MTDFIYSAIDRKKQLSSYILRAPLLFMLIGISIKSPAQGFFITDPEVIDLHVKVLPAPIRQFKPDPGFREVPVRKLRAGYHSKSDWILHEFQNKNALPKGPDPALQEKYGEPVFHKSLISSFQGMKYTEVNPSDPTLDVGPDHIVQMINGLSGAYLEVYNKSGQVLVEQVYFDSYTGINGLGDPIVLYDHLADRWLLSEFAADENMLVVAISQTGDPTGAYYIYSFETPFFPDYPKFAVWPDAYYITTNENTQAVYALDRNRMLNGENATSQRFTLPNFPTIGFQAATPVNLAGHELPPGGTPGLIMRMADDAWSPDIPADRLEIYEFSVDWANPSNSHLSGPSILLTESFDTELCGYTSFACIEQPIVSMTLDPMREVIMNKIVYRNFGSYQALACTHVVDVNQNDHAGVRWYELRNSDESWEIYQQGTYAPDENHRWMSSIALNEDGSIGLGYNVSSSEIYPSLRFTGRKICDPPGMMTIPETEMVTGGGFNGSNRYGDYNTMAVDPADGSFWFTGQYNPSFKWGTRIVNFEVTDDCFGYRLYEVTNGVSICSPEEALIGIDLKMFGGFEGDIALAVEGLPDQMSAAFSENPVAEAGSIHLTIGNTESVSPGIYPFQIVATSGDLEETTELDIGIYREISEVPVLLSPGNNSFNTLAKPEFSWNQMANAGSYDLQLSYDPDFSEIILEQHDIADNHFQNTDILDAYQPTYWRVRARNSCQAGPWSDRSFFMTEKLTCDTYAAGDVPIEITEEGAPIIESKIYFDTPGRIRDVKLMGLSIHHDWIGDLVIELEGPSGTVIQLVDGICSGQDDMLLTFSDSGLPNQQIPCPPVNGTHYKPIDAFAAFFDEERLGEWILRIRDQAMFDGGELKGWNLEICTAEEVQVPSEPCDGSGELILPSGFVADGHYSTNQYILSSGRIPVSGTVTFQAMQHIELTSGFEVRPGAQFEAFIGPCLDSGVFPATSGEKMEGDEEIKGKH